MTGGDSLMVEHQANLSESGGSIPTSSLQYNVCRVTYTITNEFYKKHHYIGKSLVCPVHYGGFEDGVLTECISFGYLPSPHVPQSVWKLGNNSNTLELRRLSSVSQRKNAESYFIKRALIKLKSDYPHIRLLFSYADEKAGHLGIIYQASNFLYVGLRAGKTLYYLDNCGRKIHSRTVGRWLKTGSPNLQGVDITKKTVDTSRKHLYIYILHKKDREQILGELRCPLMPYPRKDK